MHLIHGALPESDAALREIAIRVDRLTLAKRRWRGFAEDGVDFGFELESPLKHRDGVHQTDSSRYVIVQMEEPVLEVGLDVPASAAAGMGWAIGNLHVELQAEPARLLAPDEPAVRQLFDRLKVAYRPTLAVFRPGRFARGKEKNHELGPSHQH
jgi:urease accessory protein